MGYFVELADGDTIAASANTDYELIKMPGTKPNVSDVPYRVIQLAVWLDVGAGSEDVTLTWLVSHDGVDWYPVSFYDLSTTGADLITSKQWTVDQARALLYEFRGAWPYVKVNLANAGANTCTVDLVASVA